MRYSRDCSEDPAQLAATRAHVIAHLSSVCSEHDSEIEFASEVRVSMSMESPGLAWDMVRITGEIDREPKASYLNG